jgi:hypothetical protein
MLSLIMRSFIAGFRAPAAAKEHVGAGAATE